MVLRWSSLRVEGRGGKRREESSGESGVVMGWELK